ncbi:MAG: cytochrome c-type biogenesis protein [Hyphomicrobiaceae bacterium]|nr:cytochrome c-type biogenesis protein [Hyphomicrobiaceae bacterium]
MLVIAVLATSTAGALAVQPDERLSDPALEARARKLSVELRCLVCQNQSIDDSDAPLARDLRLLVRERLKAGDSDAEVLGFVVERYGEFALLRPTFGWHTLLLWLAPVLALGGGLYLAWTVMRSGRRLPAAAASDGATALATSPSAPLSAEEKARLERLLSDER